MTSEDIKARQAAGRAAWLQAILDSPARKKLVIGGPGTGKTYTFRRVLEQRAGGNNLAMTFINALVDDMQADLAEYAEVKTFHAYCKKILHQLRGGVELVPYLTKVVECDAGVLGKQLEDFDTHLRTLDENSPEIAFYLSRGDYYGVVSFDDSVYRLYQILRTDPSVVPQFDQIVVDEFQDFNPLEAAFIGELEKHGPIIIAGDDDQAVYDQRCASPDHLREKHASGDYAVFELPFCTRCPDVVVRATNAIVGRAESLGYMKGRIPKPLECYLDAKGADSAKYPSVVLVECSTPTVVPTYLVKEISAIDSEDIAQSHQEGDEYPTVLIAGQRQYLRAIESPLKETHPQLEYRWTREPDYGLPEAYELLLNDPDSNLGWRIVLELSTTDEVLQKALLDSEDGVPMVKLLHPGFVERHLEALKIVKALKGGDTDPAKGREQLAGLLAEWSDGIDDVLERFAPREKEDQQVDKTQPSILLSSFVGCKGLSAGHVFIVGAHNGAIPKNPKAIEDAEVSQFIVALTRTRKRCHIVSNRLGFFSKGPKAKRAPKFHKSVFTSWIPGDLINDRGYLTAADFR